MIPTVPNEIDANKINNDIFYNGLSEIKKHINYSLEDLIEYLESEISSYGGDTKYKISKIAYCEDKFGNPYLFVEFNPFGTLLMSLINNETVLINIGDPVKRIEKLNSNEVYIFDHILYEFSKKSKDYEKVENNSLSKNFTRNLVDVKKSISNKNSFNARARTTFKNSDNARFYKKSDSNYTDPENKLVYADKEVKYSWWFKGLKDNFGYSSPKDDWNFNTKNGICHHIAASILLQYSQLFLSNRTLSDRQLKRYMTVL
ncbi:Uncharacterised protein [Metamycoplasma arthritidis]|uniref:Uncharacterized protein n=1 Tax=Metamycoplasma arthritidis (strain 158L3-1) TaxID=243272 RepID=B3PNF2_META1|nr:hypothetical protein [Metamycoplasma arthritidis]ACF07554.1 hypothetical protein MARTH_orf827 [Metamycoplasma arthritidis 158L3-1]VEU79062.1 Uncharacterised protein [Metamycoplasma arthritidis]